MPNPPDHEETLFLAAREITDPAQRAAFLDRACRSDPTLRERLERLLAVDGPAARLWADDPATSDPQTLRIEEPEPVAEGPGSVIGRYKLLEQIGEGGMGVVYMTTPTTITVSSPVHRSIAAYRNSEISGIIHRVVSLECL